MKKIVVALFFLFSKGISPAAQNIDSTLLKYATAFGQERTYLHYDKNTYAPGETIWFKAYLMDGINPAFASKNFYIDWTDDKGNLLSHTVSPLQAANTNGQYDIPAEYKGNFIHVKAYTKWMLNFDSSFIYEKDIRIISRYTGPATTMEKAVPSIMFFPEGGDAVEGITNKIAFKANDQWGKPVNVKGIIKDKQGKTVDSLRTQHDGMGYFLLFPAQGENFIAKWKDEKGVEYTTALPAIKPTGISLQVSKAGMKRNFSINAEPGTATRLGKVTLVGTMNQFKVFSVTRDISKGTAQGFIPTQDLPSGILTITVFDDKWNPLAERITYINNEEYLFDASMEVIHWGLNKRARNEIEITIPDSSFTNLSVAVTDVAIDRDSSHNIISHFLLSGDIKGQVYNPTYYFSNNTDKVAADLDLVMLTHGWRRFNWDDVVKGKLPKINYPRDTAYMSLSGKVYGVTPSQLRDNPNIIAVLSQKENTTKANNYLFIPVNPDGTFNDPTTIFFDTANIYFQLSKSIKNATVKFMESRLPAYRNRIPAKGYYFNQLGDTTGFSRHFQLADDMATLLRQYEGKVLENVIVKAKTKTPIQVLDEKYASGLFGGGDGYQFDLVNDNFANSAPNIFSYLQGKVAGLTITGDLQSPSLQWRGGTPQLYLDEVPADIDFLKNVNVNDVAYIKVFRPPFMGGFGGSAGAIAVYTRRGNDKQNEPGKGLSNNTTQGYSLIRQFYSPNYSSFNAANDQKDFRTTIYWNPQVVTTPQQNKALLTFYNNDVSKAFRVIIEGMSQDGRLVHLEQIIE